LSLDEPMNGTGSIIRTYWTTRIEKA